MTARLEVSGLDYGMLRGAALRVNDGSCVCISGVSGSGKTRLLRAIADLDPNRGRVLLEGRPRETYTGPQWRQRVMLVPSESAWWAETAAEHWSGCDVEEDLEALGFGPEVGRWSVTRLSAGERQRLSLVRAMARAPRVLLMDEPTANLDATTTRMVEAWLARRRCDGLSLLWVSHDPAQIHRVADRHLRLHEGRLEAVDG